jgi:hypothetical protein
MMIATVRSIDRVGRLLGILLPASLIPADFRFLIGRFIA